MSKNPAWNAYNESVRKINEDYESKVRPLRVALSTKITDTEKRFDAKIEPLVREKKKLVENLKTDYTDKVTEAEKERTRAIKAARDVLNAELAAKKDEKKEEVAA